MGLAAFNRMRYKYNEKMKASNIEEPKPKIEPKEIEEQDKTEKINLGPRKKKVDKE